MSADFTIPASPIIDSNSSAVILDDIGEIQFCRKRAKLVLLRISASTTRIKILNKKAFDNLTTVRIGLYRNETDAEVAGQGGSASTYNLENGQVTEVKLEKKDIFQDRKQRNLPSPRFTLPGVREGSIIDYSYTVTSAFVNTLPRWRFQSSDTPVSGVSCR